MGLKIVAAPKGTMAFALMELETQPVAVKATTPCPVHLTRLAGLDISARYHSARRGGDFFDGTVIGSRLVFLLTEIDGPRIEAHAIAAEAQVAFRQRAWELFEPAEANESDAIAMLAHDVNRSLMEAANGVRVSPTFLACFNAALGILTYCNAGRVLATFRDTQGVCVLERGGVPLGLFSHATYEPAVLAFEPGDRLLLVTRGVSESRRGTAEFGARRIERLLEHSTRYSATQLCDRVLRQAYDFGNHPWSRVYDFLRSRKQRSQQDLTAVALIRT